MVDAVQDRASFPQLDENIPTTYFSVRKMIRAKRLDPAHQFMETTEFLATMAAELTNGDGERTRASTSFGTISRAFLRPMPPPHPRTHTHTHTYAPCDALCV